MYPVARRDRQKGFISLQNTVFQEPVKNLTKEADMIEQIKKFPIGTTVLFCDRDFVINATVIENSIPGQVSVIDKQGYIHLGKIESNKEYQVMTMVGMQNKYKNGYNPEKSNGVPLFRS